MRVLVNKHPAGQQEYRRTCKGCRSVLGVHAHDLTFNEEDGTYWWHCESCRTGNRMLLRGVADWFLKVARDGREYVTSGRAARDAELRDYYSRFPHG